MIRISVCISTHERSAILPRVLGGLAIQDRPADEIVVVDSSRSDASADVVQEFAEAHPRLPIRHVRSPEPALPWNRWLGFTESVGDVILFLDDDVRLAAPALRTLQDAYRAPAPRDRPVSGVGFLFTWDDGAQQVRHPHELKERWLGTSRRATGTMGPGGIPVTPAGLLADHPVPVDHFWGGAMSYRRDVLARIGYLDRLVALYRAGIGRAEDIVLSTCARAHGDLLLITQPYARHPRVVATASTPYARGGWRMGVTNTWGKAHTLRWAATDRRAHRRDVVRLITLELARSAWQVLRRPLGSAGWRRLAGSVYGAGRTIVRWRRIPASPRSASADNEARPGPAEGLRFGERRRTARES